MERTFVEKIFNADKGSLVVARPDYILSHDNSGQIRRIFQKLNSEDVFDPEQIIIVIDGKHTGISNESSMEYASIQNFIEEQRIPHFYDFDKGICHQILADILKPGMLVTGSDSHTSTAGAFNCLALNVDKTEAAVIWKSGVMWFRVPETIKITLKNKLPEGVVAKDLALWVLGMLSSMEVNCQVVEFHGEGVNSLTIDDRMAIANIVPETNLLAAIFPPDDILADYFNEPAVRGIWADKNANYSRFLEIDLAAVFPLIYKVNERKIESVDENLGLNINLGLIGACATGRLEDLRTVSMVLQDKNIADDFQLFAIPASREIYLKAVEEGVAGKISKSGTVILGSSCGACIGVSHIASASGRRFISSANSGFIKGLSHANVEEFVASPLTIAETALKGKLSTVINFSGAKFKYQPKTYEETRLEKFDYRKNSNVWNYSDVDNISCNQIFSQQQSYKISSTQLDTIKTLVLKGLDENFAQDVRQGDSIIAGENFGCGNLVKHAVIGLKNCGINFIIVKSVNKDFYRLAMNHGLWIIINWEIAEAFKAGDRISYHAEDNTILINDKVYNLPPIENDIINIMEKGGLVNAYK